MTAKPLILIIDNNPGDHLLCQTAFAEGNLVVDVQTAMDGQAGITALQHMMDGTAPMCSLVILDLNMPRIDGRRVLTWARGHRQLAALPIIILTSSEVPRDRDECFAAGDTAFLVKPGTFDGYLDLMPTIVSRIDATRT